MKSVKKGTDACFINTDTQDRWPASNIHPTHEIFPEFDPKGPIAPHETWCFRFRKAGLWRFHDHLLPELVGMVTVE